MGSKPAQEAAVQPVEVVRFLTRLLNTISFGHGRIPATYEGAGPAAPRGHAAKLAALVGKNNVSVMSSRRRHRILLV